jgi:hypothetical protein
MRRPVVVNLFLCSWGQIHLLAGLNAIPLHAELPLLSPPFHPHSGVSVCSLGASWVFSIQPVLPPVIATFHSISQTECWARPMTQSPELGL